MTDRKFIEQTPFRDAGEAAQTVVDMIQRAGAPGHVWYHPPTDRVRVCAPDYAGVEGEMLLGVYTRTATRARIAADLKAARASSPTVKRTRSVTVSETVETTEVTKNIPQFIPAEPEPVAVIPASEKIQEVSELSDEIGKLPEAPVVASLPAIPAPAKDDAYGSAVWALVAQRDKIDARLAELQLLRFLFDRKASDRLAFLLEDYVEFLQSALDCMDDDEDSKQLEGYKTEAAEWARRFALNAWAKDDSIFARAAKVLREMGQINEDCSQGDNSSDGDKRRAEAIECNEIATIFEFVSIKPPEPK